MNIASFYSGSPSARDFHPSNLKTHLPHNSNEDPFFTTLSLGFPEKRIYGFALNDKEIESIEEVLDRKVEAEYSPKGWEEVSLFLEKPWVKVAITVGSIAIICWCFPGALATASTIILKPLRSLNALVQTVLSMIPGVNFLTQQASPLIQLGAGIAVLVAGIFTSPKFARGSAASTLTTFNPYFILETTSIFILGFLFNPKRFSINSSSPCIASSYENALLKMVFSATVIVPILEELVFRVALPFIYEETLTLAGRVLEWITQEDYTKETRWLIKKTNILFCSVVFGAAHFQNDHFLSFSQSLYCGWASVRIMHPVMESQGVEGSIGEHMMNNTTAMLSLIFSRK